MSVINTFFDKVLVINLKNRPDRLEKTDEQLSRWGIKYEVVDAVNGQDDALVSELYSRLSQQPFNERDTAAGRKIVTKGKLGCLLSHLSVYQRIKKEGWDKTLIFEDDILLARDFDKRIEILHRIPDNWSMLYLGASDYKWRQNRARLVNSGAKGYYAGSGAVGRFAYALRQNIIDTVLEMYSNQERWDRPGDVLLSPAQTYGLCYFVYPNIVIADVRDSDLRRERDIIRHAEKLGWDLSMFCLGKQRRIPSAKPREEKLSREETLKMFTQKINTGDNFFFIKYGDGEFYAMEGKPGSNCDGHPYSPKLGGALRKAFINQSNYGYIADYNTKYREDLIAEHGLSPNFVPFNVILHDKHDALTAELHDFYASIRNSNRKKIYVGPERLKNAVKFLKTDRFIAIPQVNAFEHYEQIKQKCINEIERDAIFLISAGMNSCLLIDDLAHETEHITCIDIGSGLDNVLFGRTRKNQVPRAELLQFYQDFGIVAYQMPHFYKEIPGWFNYQELYHRMVKEAPKKARFAEIGVWMGKSTAFLGTEIINANKGIKLDVVDTFKGSPGEKAHQIAQRVKLVNIFKRNTAPVAETYTIHEMPSTDAAKQFKDGTFWFVFIDAAHDYDSVKADIEAWLPKVKKGGYIGGHDYKENWQGVVKAVDERFPNKEIIGTSWLVKLT